MTGQAAHWLAAGFESELLRQLAGYRSQEAGALALMAQALRSIGFDPAAADAEFAAGCQAALDIVRQDLDGTDMAGAGCGGVRQARPRPGLVPPSARVNRHVLPA
jgi:hypothetical protein